MFLHPHSSEFDSAVAELALYSPPAVIARATSPSDVAEAFTYAQAHDLAVSIRSGGHGGFDSAGTLLIDLSTFTDVEVLDGDRVRVGAGAVWGDVAASLAPHHLALTSGDTYSVGVGGLTLGGGVGWMVRQYGLALDNLLAAEVVLPSGAIVTASADSESELFWAIRGGGGNFGVVTSFTFQAHPLNGVVFGTISLDPANLADTLRAWRDVMRSSPAELNVTFLALPGFDPSAPALAPGPQLLVCWGGADEEAAARAIQPLLDLPGVTDSQIGPRDYVDALQRMEKPENEVPYVDNNSFANDFSDELITELVAAHESFGAAVLMVRYLRGAFNDVPVDATAFAHRGAEVLLISAAFLGPDSPADADPVIRARWAALGDRVTGLYGNFSPTRSSEVTALMYPSATLDRLRSAKRRYDPTNVLRVNHNVGL